MLQIRLSNKATASESGGGAKLPSGETVTVACPDHLVLAELPVAKSLGSASGVTLVKTVGRRSRRPLGERVHFCVQCDFPIAIYGRLMPCEHAFCLDCARSDSLCYLCDERIQKIQTIKMMEGIFVCAAPHCLKSFLKKTNFESHVHAIHADLLNPNNTQKEGSESEAASAKKPSASDSTVQAPTPRPVQAQEGEDRTQRLQPPLRPKPYPEYPMNTLQPPNFVVPGPGLGPGPASFGQPLYGPDGGVEPGSLLGYPPHQAWNGAPFDPCSMMMNQGGFYQGGPPLNGKDSRGVLAATPPPALPFTQMPGGFFGGEHGQGYGWQQDKRDSFGNGQD